jgi:hypothetical protein
VARLITLNKPTPDTYKGWGFTLIAGLALAVIALFDGGNDAGNDGSCRFEVTADVLNIRVEADPNADAVGAPLARGEEVTATPTVVDGFRRLDDGRWAADQFLAPVPGSVCT